MAIITTPVNLGVSNSKNSASQTITTLASVTAGESVVVVAYTTSATIPTLTFTGIGAYQTLTFTGPSGTGLVVVFIADNHSGLSAGSSIVVSGTSTYLASAFKVSIRLSVVPRLSASLTGTSSTPIVSINELSPTEDYFALGLVVVNGPAGDTWQQSSGYLEPPNTVGTTGASAASNYTLRAGYDLFASTNILYSPSLFTSRSWAAALIVFRDPDLVTGATTETASANDTGTDAFVPSRVQESVTTNHTQDRTYVSRNVIIENEDNVAFSNLHFPITYLTLTTSTTSRGHRFISNATGQVGIVRSRFYRANTSAALPTTPGRVELWRLTSNSISAGLLDIIAVVEFNLADIPTTTTTVNLFDFSSIPGAQVTTGNGYAIVIRPGTDWTASTQYITYTYLTTTSSVERDSFVNTFVTLNGTTVTGSFTQTANPITTTITTTTNYYNLSVQLAANTVIELGGFDAFSDQTETGSLVETQTGIYSPVAARQDPTNGDSASGLLPYFSLFSNVSSVAPNLGIVFTAPRTGIAGPVRGVFGKANFVGANIPTTKGRFELYAHATSTFLGQVEFTFIDDSNVPANTVIDFTPLNITLTQGTVYRLVMNGGADWNTTGFLAQSIRTLLKNYDIPVQGYQYSSVNSTIPSLDLEYASTNLEINSGGFISFNAASESVTPSHVDNYAYTSNNWNHEFSDTGYVMNTLNYPWSVTSTATLVARGARFISNFTGRIGFVYSRFYRTGSGTYNLPTTLGTVELWTLSTTTTVTGTLLSKIAEVQFDLATIPTSTTSVNGFDFTNVVGADVVKGNAYAILVRPASDWTTTSNNQYITFYIASATTSTNFNPYNTLRTLYNSTNWSFTTPVGSNTLTASTSVNFFSITSANKTLADDNGGIVFVGPQDETITSNEQSNNTAIFRPREIDYSIADSFSGHNSVKTFPLLTASSGAGFGFISNESVTLGEVSFDAYRIVSDLTSPSNPGKVTVWSGAGATSLSSATLLGSIDVNHSDLPSPVTVQQLTNTLLGPASLTLRVSTSNDDSFTVVNIPWQVEFLGVLYNSVSVGSNSYLTFGGGSALYSGLTSAIPTLPKIMISAADNSYQRVYEGTEGTAPNRRHRIRYEGNNATSGTPGSPGILWEATFYENNPAQIDIQIANNARGGGGISGVFSETRQYAFFPTLSNYGYRITTTQPKDPTLTVDFTPLAISLTSGQRYFIGFECGSDWGISKQYAGISVVNTDTGTTDENYYLNTIHSYFIKNGVNPWNVAHSYDSSSFFKILAKTTNNVLDGKTASNVSTQTRSEPITASESTTRITTANTWINSTDPQLETLYKFTSNSGSTTGAGNTVAATFIAKSTGTINTIQFAATFRQEASANPTQPGAIELWQLSSNSLNSPPSTLLQTQSLYMNEVVRAGSANIIRLPQVNFNVTAGVGYAIAIRNGSDWTSSFRELELQSISDQWQPDFNYAYSLTRRYTRTGAGAWSSQTNLILRPHFFYSNTVEENLGGFDTAVDQTDSVTASAIEFGGRGFTALDEESNADSLIKLRTYAVAEGGINGTGTTPIGNTFIAPKTGSLGRVRVLLTRILPNSSTDLGSVQLWQLASNSPTALPQTLIASAPLINPATIQTAFNYSNSNYYEVDLTSETGFSVTSGVGYALIISPGANWTNILGFTRSKFSGNIPPEDLLNKYRYVYNTGTWQNQEGYFLLMHADYVNKTVDVQSLLVTFGGERNETLTATEFSTNLAIFRPVITETAPAVDILFANYRGVATKLESLTALDTLTNTTVFRTTRSEIASSSDSSNAVYTFFKVISEPFTLTEQQISQANFAPVINEQVTAIDTKIANFVALKVRTETGAVSDDVDSVLSIERDLTESLTSLEESTNLVTFDANSLELGAALDQSFNIANFVTFRSELSEAVDTLIGNGFYAASILNTVSSTEQSIAGNASFQTVNELVTALEQRIGAAARIADITETGSLVENQENYLIAGAFILEQLLAQEQSLRQRLQFAVITNSVSAVENQQAVYVAFLEVADALNAQATENVILIADGRIVEDVDAVHFSKASNFLAVVFNEETLSAISEEFGLRQQNTEISELLASQDSQSSQAIFRALISELGLAEDDVVSWLFRVYDYDDLVSSFTSADVKYDAIYADGVEVFYGKAAMITDVEVDTIRNSFVK